MFWTKGVTVPETNETRQIEAIQLWYVRWTARKGAFNSDAYPVMEAFPSEQLANEFADSLKQAFKLLKHTSEGTKVEVSCN